MSKQAHKNHKEINLTIVIKTKSDGSSRLRYLVPDTPDSTSVVSGWCTYDPERLSSAVYTGTENLHTSSDARSLWQHWREGKRISLSTDFGFQHSSSSRMFVCINGPKHFNTHGTNWHFNISVSFWIVRKELDSEHEQWHATVNVQPQQQAEDFKQTYLSIRFLAMFICPKANL